MLYFLIQSLKKKNKKKKLKKITECSQVINERSNISKGSSPCNVRFFI